MHQPPDHTPAHRCGRQENPSGCSLGLVLLEAGDVLVHGLLAPVLAAVVHRDTDGGGNVDVDAGGLQREASWDGADGSATLHGGRSGSMGCATHLELLEGEPAAQLLLGLVLDGLAVDDGAQRAGDGAREDLLGLLSAGCKGGRTRSMPASLPRPIRPPRPHTWVRMVIMHQIGRPPSMAQPPVRPNLPCLRLSFRAGWLNQVRTRVIHELFRK